MPCSIEAFAAVSAAICAANGVLLREPRKPRAAACGCPRDCVAVKIGNGYEGVIEGRTNVNLTALNVLAFTTLAGSKLLCSLC